MLVILVIIRKHKLLLTDVIHRIITTELFVLIAEINHSLLVEYTVRQTSESKFIPAKPVAISYSTYFPSIKESRC